LIQQAAIGVGAHRKVHTHSSAIFEILPVAGFFVFPHLFLHLSVMIKTLLIITALFSITSNIFSQISIDINLLDEYIEIPVLGANLKPDLQPSWDQEDFINQLSILEPQTLRWPGAEASNYFDWHKGTLMPCYKWTGASHPWDHINNVTCGNATQADLCDTPGIQSPRFIQSDTLVGNMRTANYVQNHASDYINALDILDANNDDPLTPFFVLNVLSPEYLDPDSIDYDSCISLEGPVNTINQQLDSIAILTSGMDETFIQLSNEPWHEQDYKNAIWPNASSYFERMISIAELIDQHPGLQHAKVGLFADVHSMDIEADECINGGYNVLRCTWNDSMHIVLSDNDAYDLFDAFSIHKYTGLKNMQIPSNLNDNCEPIDDVWENIRTDTLISNYSDCQISYLIKWMIITRDQMFDTFDGGAGYDGLYESIFDNYTGKDLWITEYDIMLDNEYFAFNKDYSNGWSHALYNLYTTMKYITEVPNLKVLIQNNAVGYSGGYRLIDTYSYIDTVSGTNNSKYHGYWQNGVEFRHLVSNTFLGLSPKGEAIRLVNQLAWRNNFVTAINFNPNQIDSTEVRGYDNVSYFAKDLYGWAFDQGDFLFMNISNDTLKIVLEDINTECCIYDFTILNGSLHAKNYQTDNGSGLDYETDPEHQVLLWEFDDEISIPSTMADYFSATDILWSSSGQVNSQNEFFEILPHSVLQVLKSNTVSTNNAIELLQYSINNIYPNPFNPTAMIAFTISQTDLVTVKVYNIIGKKITTLINSEVSVGNHTIQWDGNHQPSGVYFVQIESGGFVDTKKMVLLK